MSEKIPVETILGNIAYHVLCITQLDPDTKNGRLRCSPLVDMPMVDIVATRMSNGYLTYTVNGIDVGNVNGAISAFSVLCSPYLKEYFNCEGETFRAKEDPQNYYTVLRNKLMASVGR